MGGGRAPDAVWRYATPNTDPATKEKKPYKNIFTGLKHSQSATKFKLYLAFDCPEFMRQRPLEWQTLVVSLTNENIKTRKAEDNREHVAAGAWC